MHLALRHLNEKNDDGKKYIYIIIVFVGISACLYRDAYAADSYTRREHKSPHVLRPRRVIWRYRYQCCQQPQPVHDEGRHRVYACRFLPSLHMIFLFLYFPFACPRLPVSMRFVCVFRNILNIIKPNQHLDIMSIGKRLRFFLLLSLFLFFLSRSYSSRWVPTSN